MCARLPTCVSGPLLLAVLTLSGPQVESQLLAFQDVVTASADEAIVALLADMAIAGLHSAVSFAALALVEVSLPH